MPVDIAEYLPPLLPWLACALAVTCGTVVQKLSGAGFGMIAAPIMTITAPEWVPGTILLLGVLIGIGAVLGARDAIVRSDLPAGFSGRLIGAVLAAFVASAVVGTDLLPVVIALIVLFAVALSLAGLSMPITPQTLFGAGVTAGIMGTLTGIGAPPMAILYSRVEARRSAATQNAFFGFGMIVSIGALAFAGLIRGPQIALAVSLAPLVPLTLIAVRPLVARFERGAIRPWALGLATLSALILLTKAL
ncbi:sulfite exporter TauE/SafE family protein [Oceanicola sp. D3]|uniref:TSUP family transporter n=1 Tax=Oceanicola sp. D3 TaxID=2587163 RepID=UPI0011246E4F|nr:TSUP family transporter [Oceanicola sp. D3]QDC11351.1 sulfite exporter TauE/SafE family protein [Oceanicola sp. D3]